MADLLLGVNPEAAVAGLLSVALLGFLAAVSRGLLVPRSHVTDVQAAADKRAAFAEVTAEKRIAEVRDDRDERIANTLAVTEARIAETLASSDGRIADVSSQRDDWREAFRASDARADVLSTQVSQVVEGQRAVVSFIQSVSRVAGREPPE